MRSIAYCLIVVCGILGYSDLMFAQTPAPQITPIYSDEIITEVATDITSNSATLNGTLPGLTMAGAAYFEYGTTSRIYTSKVSTGTSGKVSARISGLSPAQTYYYRLFIVQKGTPSNPTGHIYGKEKSFTTLEATATPTQNPMTTPIASPTWPEHMDCPCLIEEGYVKDATTNKGIANAIVSNGKDLILETNTYGVFRLCDESSSYYGTHTFTASANGYLPSLPQAVYFEYCVGSSLTFELLPECEVKWLLVSPNKLNLQKSQTSEVVVTLEGVNCVPEGKTVTATINKAGNKRISISSTSEITDENGQVKFTIAAKNKIGKARVTFNTDSLKKTLIIKVK